MNMAEAKTFIRVPSVIAATGMSRSNIYEKINAGIFPAPVQIGPREVAWNSGAIAAWQAACISANRPWQLRNEYRGPVQAPP